MSGEVPYFSRFLVKFVEIIAAGFASAISAYLLAHFGGVLLSYPDLLRPEPPMPIGEAPRPPMPVVTASPEREFGN